MSAKAMQHKKYRVNSKIKAVELGSYIPIDKIVMPKLDCCSCLQLSPHKRR